VLIRNARCIPGEIFKNFLKSWFSIENLRFLTKKAFYKKDKEKKSKHINRKRKM